MSLLRFGRVLQFVRQEMEAAVTAVTVAMVVARSLV